MVETVGLTAEVITGISKDIEGNVSENKHAWFFLYTHAYDGMFIDPTWGAGTVNGVKYIKSEDHSTWFKVSPYWMIFSHFPDEQSWTRLDIDVTEEQFRELPIDKIQNETNGQAFLSECITQINENKEH